MLFFEYFLKLIGVYILSPGTILFSNENKQKDATVFYFFLKILFIL